MNLFDHPMAVPDWEVVEASPVRVIGRSMWADRPDAGAGRRIVQARAVQGHSVFTADAHRADVFEMASMREAADLLPVQRALERERSGAVTS